MFFSCHWREQGVQGRIQMSPSFTRCSHLIHFSSNGGEQSPLEGEAQSSREQLSEMTSCRSSERKGLEDELWDPTLSCRDSYRRCVSWVFNAGLGAVTVTFLHNPLLTSVPSLRSTPPPPAIGLLQKPLDWPPVFIQLHDSVFATEQLESSHVPPHLRFLQWLQPTQKQATVLTMAFSLLFSLALPPTAHPFAPWAPAPLTSLLSPQILFTGFLQGFALAIPSDWNMSLLESSSLQFFTPLSKCHLSVWPLPLSSTSVLFFSIDFTTDVYYNSPTFFFCYCLSTLLEC